MQDADLLGGIDYPNLNVVTLFKSFQQYYFEQKGKTLSMKYQTYHQFFRQNSCYNFRKPRFDICDYCRETELMLNVNPNDPRIIDYGIRRRSVQKYNSLKQGFLEEVKNCANEDTDTLVLEFDFSQNLAIPRLDVTAQFYKHINIT
ncbi:hypothetical protein ANN_08704 [Periplaneta americana]|uniref:Uncharacterized protein n=1 Tax=Periplaneta americana TaxID=6978 RepID=A0ABQ8T255_PERAM|nr:hypothetical protein ANN_08704 [Periplaneta americana]